MLLYYQVEYVTKAYILSLRIVASICDSWCFTIDNPRELLFVSDHCGKGFCSGGAELKDGWKNKGKVGARAGKDLLNGILKLPEGTGININLPFEILTKFLLHSVYIPKLEHALANDWPRLTWLFVIRHDLQSDHECWNEEMLTRWATGGGEANLQVLQE